MTSDRTTDRLPDLPALAAGRILLIAESGDLERHNLDLRLAAVRSDPSESAVFVTTETDADRMIRRYRAFADDASEPLGVVDTVSQGQSLPATYRETPTVFVPGPHEVARVAVALSDVSRPGSARARRRHLVFQSLTPLLESVDPAVVARFVRRATRSRTIDGFSIFRVDFTAHDEATMDRLRELSDLVLWVEEAADGALDCDLERASPGRGPGDERASE